LTPREVTADSFDIVASTAEAALETDR
jgi:hypothetical protein